MSANHGLTSLVAVLTNGVVLGDQKSSELTLESSRVAAHTAHSSQLTARTLTRTAEGEQRVLVLERAKGLDVSMDSSTFTLEVLSVVTKLKRCIQHISSQQGLELSPERKWRNRQLWRLLSFSASSQQTAEPQRQPDADQDHDQDHTRLTRRARFILTDGS